MNIYEILKKLNINYQEIEHEAVFTIEEAKNIKNRIPGIGCKNLLLKDKKQYLLVILEENKKADTKQIAKIANCSHLSFAKEEELEKILKLKRGSISPFGIINDQTNVVTILIDKDLQNQILLFHPNINTKTVAIHYNDLIKFIEFENHNYILL